MNSKFAKESETHLADVLRTEEGSVETKGLIDGPKLWTSILTIERLTINPNAFNTKK